VLRSLVLIATCWQPKHEFWAVIAYAYQISCAIFQVDDMGRRRVWAVMKSGERWEGDILVGADGIHSKASVASRPCMPVAPHHCCCLVLWLILAFCCTATVWSHVVPEQSISMQFA